MGYNFHIKYSWSAEKLVMTKYKIWLAVGLSTFLMIGCTSQEADPTATLTEPIPLASPVPATASPIPATASPVPATPTSTLVPPTPTPEPPVQFVEVGLID